MARSTKGVNIFDVLNVQEERNDVPMTEIIRAVDNIKEVSFLQLNLFKCVSQFYANVVISTDVSLLLCRCCWPMKISVCANIVIMVALCNRADHYIFMLWLLLSSFFVSSFFPRLISAVGDWMSTILPHMVWP